ncbi:MAG: ATP-dependent Clp protease ATP-binding subunit ClpA, partial [Phyllobacteriaceae bacterium]|nr:ATP-dependent Clp protease ATP-binding subunit ClpA [Phyllobacteriaceae bacterium]
LFTPEFRNRLDAVVNFGNLPLDVIRQVVSKFVIQLEAQLADRNVTFELDEAATDWLATHGYDRQMGARPLGRVIQEHIKKPLADEVLFGKLKRGGVVKVTVGPGEDGVDELKLEAIPAVTAVAAPAPEPEVKATKARAKKAKSGLPAVAKTRAVVKKEPQGE